MRSLSIAALLLLGCAAPAVQKATEVTCRSWLGDGDVRVITKEAMTTEFECAERICWTLSDGTCFYGCPQDRMPVTCK
jgi:hypothetical protein